MNRVLTLAFALCLASLCFGASSSTPAPLTTTSCRTAFDSLPQDMMTLIAQAMGTADLTSLTSTSTEWHQICQEVLIERKTQHYIGHVPTFLPAMKLCMMDDDLDCYDSVMNGFKSQNQGKPWRLAQLPALAIQLDASKIFFQRLHVTKEDPRWKKWMTRSLARRSRSILQDVKLQPPYPYPPSKERKRQRYDLSSKYRSHTQFSYIGYRPPGLPRLEDSEKLFFVSEKQQAMYDWIDLSINNRSSYPSLETITSVLEVADVEERRQQIVKLKSEMKKVLSKGIFIVDDMLVNPEITFLLWSRYVDDNTNHTMNATDAGASSSASVTTYLEDDGGRAEFFEWLIEEGAPLEDNDMIESLQYENSIIRGKYKRWIKLCTQYMYRSGTEAMIDFFKQDPRHLMYHKSNLVFFKTFLEANVTHPTLLKYMVESGYQDWQEDGLEYMIENGLTMREVKALRIFATTLPASQSKLVNDERSRLLSTMESLARKHTVETRYPKSPDWVKSWLAIFI